MDIKNGLIYTQLPTLGRLNADEDGIISLDVMDIANSANLPNKLGQYKILVTDDYKLFLFNNYTEEVIELC